MNNILEKLGVSEINYGACIGGDRWIKSNDSGIIESINPTDNKLLAKVNKCNENDYELVIKESSNAFEKWRMVPAPIRGQLILEMANELRNKKDDLGNLVALEMGTLQMATRLSLMFLMTSSCSSSEFMSDRRF